MKNRLNALRAWLAHDCIMMAVRFDMNVAMRRAHTLVCHAAARAAIEAGAEGDLRVRIIVDDTTDDSDNRDEWEVEPDIDLNTVVSTTVH